MSDRQLYSPSFRLLARRLGVRPGPGVEADRDLEYKLAQTVVQTTQIDAAVVLALDALYLPNGRLDARRTHFWVTNDYVMRLVARHPKLLFGCSVHPYRPDAMQQLDRCVRGGAVLMKWLPIVQDIDPADPRCFPIYEALAHHRLPLLCHTGIEHSLPMVNPAWGDPRRLIPALERGVTVIAAHCGSREVPMVEPNWIPQFIRMAHDYERLYGDTAAMNVPNRNYAYRWVLRDRVVRDKLVHGSDWPLPSVPPVMRLGPARALALSHDPNWLRRDLRIKQAIGFDEAYWHRGASLLRLPQPIGRVPYRATVAAEA